MPRSLVPWLVVVPIATLGVLLGHEIAYASTGTASPEVHGYLHHVPQVALILIVLTVVGAALAERGARTSFWPYPAVALVGFVAQEHLERLQHTGSLPFLLDQRFFLVGIVVQCLIALLLWAAARLLIATLAAEDVPPSLRPSWETTMGTAPRSVLLHVASVPQRSRAPPLGC